MGSVSTAVVLIACAIALCSRSASFFSGLYFVPFALGPLFVSLVFAGVLKAKKRSQVALTIGSVLYGFWFAFAFLDIFYWHQDPQSGIALLFVGVYSLPGMAIVWIVTALLGRARPEAVKSTS